jgi:alpha-tubulin suppressor-like RCC1 family protein
MREGGKGAAVKFHFVPTPREVVRFVQKDSRDKITSELSTRDVRIGAVAAGKNHSICLEKGGLGRVFTCGFGGYGRLGHNSANDETLFREVTTFQQLVQGQQIAPTMAQKQITQIIGGSSFSMAISKSQNLYFWGKLANSARGEATMYPTANTDLTGWHCRQVAGGSNSVIVAADDRVVAWGVPVAGKWGLEGGAKSTVGAKFLTAVDQLRVIDVSAGYAHVSFLVNAENPAAEAILAAFPVMDAPPEAASSSSAAAGKGKKRPAPADNTANKKKSAAKK